MSTQQDLLRPSSDVIISLDQILATRNVEVVSLPKSARTNDDTKVCGITVNSQDVSSGDVFVGVAGLKAHGARFADAAIAQGAVAVLTDNAGIALLRESGVISSDGTSPVPVILGPTGSQLRHEMARWATMIYGDHSKNLNVSGITGTNGKTTTAFFLDAIHRAAGTSTALLGTVEMRLGHVSVPSQRTTVEAPVLQGFFARCVEEKIGHVTMEVSSHALVLDRVTGTTFDVVGFTNLQHDHLDFHHTMSEYFDAKALLFDAKFARTGVIVADDAWSRKLVQTAQIETLSIRTELSDDPTFDADYVTSNVRLSNDGLGLDFDIVGRDGHIIESHSPLLGSVNVSNAALATVMALQEGVSETEILHGLRDLAAVPGRMEVVSAEGQPLVIVDYAHTAEALDFALRSLKSTQEDSSGGKLIVVFGAAGDRDATKRPMMGQVAMKHADVVILTDDDPYSEDPAKIRDDVFAGIESAPEFVALSSEQQLARVFNIAPRESAIEMAISMAVVGDTVLLAGRGHETIQDLDGDQHILDDRVYAREVLDKLS